MPPKAKFTREEIVSAALELVRESGAEALTARALGKRLGSSACPIFTVFESMTEVWEEVLIAAKRLYGGYVCRGLEQTPAFKGVGTQYILFAKQEPKLFQLLFMQPADSAGPDSILSMLDEHYGAILKSVIDTYALEEPAAKRVYLHMWIYTHGIATLFARGAAVFSPEEISALLTEACRGILQSVKESNKGGAEQ